MTATLRGAIGRAAQFLRGPRRNPAATAAAAAAASQAEGVTMLTPARRPFLEKLVLVLREAAAEAELDTRGSASRYSTRTTHQRKKTDELIRAEPWLLAFLLAFVFLEGHYMGKRNDQKIAEAMNKHQ